MVSAYALASRSFNSYKQKVKELYGEEAHKKVMASLAAEKSTKPTISAGSLAQMTSVGFEDANEEERLFYDAISDRYFRQPSVRSYRLNTTSTGISLSAAGSSP